MKGIFGIFRKKNHKFSSSFIKKSDSGDHYVSKMTDMGVSAPPKDLDPKSSGIERSRGHGKSSSLPVPPKRNRAVGRNNRKGRVDAIIFKIIARHMPDLKEKLLRAQMEDSPEYFVKKVFVISFMGAIAFSFLFLAPIFHMFGKSLLIPFLSFFLMFFLLYSYMMKIPDVRGNAISKNVTKELVFALRFLIIELDSGTLIYDAFRNIRNNYEHIGKYFGDVIDMVDYGVDVDEALNKVVNECPSENLRMVFVQIQNSLKTGADVVAALDSAVEQFTREQHIAVNDYSKKLNPVAMFYMIVAVIFPSIGFMMLIVITSFLGFQMDLTVLLLIVALVGFIQFMFVSAIRTMRPPVDL